MRFNDTARRLYLAPALGLALCSALALSACSSSSSSAASPGSATSALPSGIPTSLPSGVPTSLPSGIPTSLPSGLPTSLPSGSSSGAAGGNSGSPATISQITTNWNKFFNSSTPNSERVKLLENGSQFSAAIASFSSSPLAAAVSSKVDSVSVTSATKAKVKYDLTALGATVANGSTGSAVLQDGTWKVGDDVFCGLLTEANSAGLSVTIPSACKTA
jgi:hypothetical protein